MHEHVRERKEVKGGRGRGWGEGGGEEERGGKEGEQRLKPNSYVTLYISTTNPLGSHEVHDSHMTTSEATHLPS